MSEDRVYQGLIEWLRKTWHLPEAEELLPLVKARYGPEDAAFLMKNANNLQTLGINPWIMTPVIFIIAAVLGFNFLGDGLRDAADPYAVVR